MHSSLRSARLAPKKADLIAKMVRGLTVPDAMELLRKTGKKGARLFEGVLRSAIANAEHNFKQDPQTMVLNSVIVNQGTSYRRGVPMARGRVRPIRKFLCHIEIGLGQAGLEKIQTNQKNQRKQKSDNKGVADTSKASKDSVKKTATPKRKVAKKSSESSVSSDSSASSSK